MSREIQSNIAGTENTEARYGNKFWHGAAELAPSDPIEVEVRYVIERRRFRPTPPAAPVREISAEERARFAAFLSPNSKVAVGHEVLQPILEEVRAAAASKEKARLARATYDWVVDNVEYKKVGTGWGNGDTFWACSERYGNCTDFHSLFISLARTENIPARFEMGFPIPEDRAEGKVGGYHCWVEFYLPDSGWFPIDASEAFKHPEKRDLFYGTHPPDRVHFTTGRDLELGENHNGPPLNYFIYPHVEVGGEPIEDVVREFSYREIPPDASIGSRTP